MGADLDPIPMVATAEEELAELPRERRRRRRRNRLFLVAATLMFVAAIVLVAISDGDGDRAGDRSARQRLEFGFEGEPDEQSLPPEWSAGAQRSTPYEFRSVNDRVFRGERAARIRLAGAPSPDAAGAFWRCERADNYHDKRVRLSGYLATQRASGDGAGVWLRADGYARETLAFDNMAGRWLTGDNAYKRAEVFLDVPDNTFQVCFGFLLAGPGTAWADELVLEAVADLRPGAQDGPTDAEPSEVVEAVS